MWLWLWLCAGVGFGVDVAVAVAAGVAVYEAENDARCKLREKLSQRTTKAPADEWGDMRSPASGAQPQLSLDYRPRRCSSSIGVSSKPDEVLASELAGEALVRRRSRDKEAGKPPQVCGVCFNPNKKLGNSKTIPMLCNRCECMIKQGWPYWQHRDPKQHQPGHAVCITNLCIHCYKQADSVEGCYEPQSHDDMSSSSTPAPTSNTAAAKKLRTSDFEEYKVEQLPESTCACVFCGQLYHDKCILYNKAVYGDIPPRCPNPACLQRWDSLPKSDADLSRFVRVCVCVCVCVYV